MNGENSPLSSDSLQVKKSGFQWVVKKEVFTGPGKGSLKSDKFDVGFQKTNWSLKLKPSVRVNDDVWVCLFLILRDNPEGHIRTKYKFGLIMKDGEEKNVKFQGNVFERQWSYDLCRFIKLESLLAEENNLFEKGKLTIFCDLEVYRKVKAPESPLACEQSQMLESGEFSDFTMVVGGEELKVHKCALSKSPVFQAMFEHDMKEKQSCRVEIEGLDLVGVKGLLEFLYTGKVKDLEKTAEEVLTAADRYGVEGLKTLCEQQLCYELHPANVAELLEIAELYTLTRLKEQAITFICENSNEVVKETSFQRLNGSDIFMEVMCALANKLHFLGRSFRVHLSTRLYNEKGKVRAWDWE